MILDYDLVELYGYEVKRLNEQVKRNIARFLEDFLKSQIDKIRSENLQFEVKGLQTKHNMCRMIFEKRQLRTTRSYRGNMKYLKQGILFILATAIVATLMYPTTTVKASEMENQISEYNTWHFDYMQVQEAWNLIDQMKPVEERTEEEKVIVATIDTGIGEHEDLIDNIEREHCVQVETYEPYEAITAGHGTSTAGLIAATSYNGIGTAGVAAGNNNDLIKLMGIKVFRDDLPYVGQGDATTEDIIKGLEYACENGAKVIHMCLGHTIGDLDATGNMHDDVRLEEAVNRAVEEYDVLIITSAGNKKDDRVWYPSDFDGVISVINTIEYTDAWSKKAKHRNSSYGEKKDISAPGTDVYTTKSTGDYDVGNGTSAASACAVGVAALVRYMNPELSATEVKEILYATATDLYTDGYDIYTGYGNINAYRAVAAAAGVELEEENEVLSGTVISSAFSVAHNRIQVSWEQVEACGGYELYRSTEKEGEYELVAQILDANTTTFTDKNCVPEQKYYYKIQVLGTSTKHQKIKSEPSRAIRGIAVTALPEIKVSRKTYRSLEIKWNRLTGADGYRIYRSTSENGTYKKVRTVEKGSTIKWEDKSCEPGKKYYYKIRAFRYADDGSRLWSQYSEVKYEQALPKKPAEVKIRLQKKKARITWKKDTSVTGYKIYRSGAEGGPWKLIRIVKNNKKNVFITKNNLKKGKTYFYKIVSYKRSGKQTFRSKSSNVVKIKR